MRALPEDFAEDPALKGYRAFVRPIIGGVSKLAVTLETSPLDEEETDSGTIAFSALMYQYGANMDARVLVGLWCVSVIVPRLTEYAQKQKERRVKQNSQTEKPVSGTVVSINKEG
jgi:hypothetical protein